MCQFLSLTMPFVIIFDQGEPTKKYMHQVFEEMPEEQKLTMLLSWERQPFGHIKRKPFVPFLNDTNVHKVCQLPPAKFIW